MTTSHTPRRIQRSRQAGWRAPLDPQGRRPVYVGRGSRWGNPNRVVYRADTGGWHIEHDNGGGIGTFPDPTEARRVAADAYRAHLDAHPELATAARELLHGRDLACWCPTPEPGQPDHCHGAVLLALANSRTGAAL